jgi:NAD(P)-dependent dehydrogenase (short-subunit alcohol dehydrogenase family)
MKHILITGCSSGVGEAAVLRLAKAGYRVTGTVRRQSDADRLAAAIGPDASWILMDVTDDRSVREGLGGLVERRGAPDVLVNNVGVPCLGSMEELRISDFRAVMETNVIGALRIYQAVAPAMRRRGSGQIINLSSSIGAAALPIYGGYCATKFALEAMSEAMRYELAPFGVTVNVLQPGIIATPFRAKKQLQRDERVPVNSPYGNRMDKPSPPDLMERISRPDEVAVALQLMIETPKGDFRRVCGRDAQAFLEARRTLDDAGFERYLTTKGYGATA